MSESKIPFPKINFELENKNNKFNSRTLKNLNESNIILDNNKDSNKLISRYLIDNNSDSLKSKKQIIELLNNILEISKLNLNFLKESKILNEEYKEEYDSKKINIYFYIVLFEIIFLIIYTLKIYFTEKSA